MVLYHCCMSAALAQARALVGFDDDDLIEVTEVPPDTSGHDPHDAYAVELLEPPAGFRMDRYPSRTGTHGRREYLIPGRVLNAFRRSAWPSDAGSV